MYDQDRNFREQRFAPVKVGDELEVKIEAVGEKGDGIAKKEGFVLFVPNAKEGQQVKIRVTKVLRKVGFAEVVGEGQAAPQEGAQAEESAGEQETQESPSEETEETQDSENFGEDETQ